MSAFFSDPYFPIYLVLIIETIIIFWLAVTIYGLLKKPIVKVTTAPQQNFIEKIWAKINPTVPIERENDILLEDHEYDGIRELDNPMPPWLKFLFYATIVFACIYGPYYLLGYGKTQEEKYDKQIVFANLQKEERMKNAQDFVDENTVQIIQTSDVLAAGKETFLSNCAACHTQTGGGDVGPNLTDDYWLHGGSIKDIYTTIKYGVPQKGMKSWENDLTPRQISEVANYIRSLKGTNPPGGIPPAGTLYTENQNKDSLNNNLDTLQTDSDTSRVNL